MASDDLISAVQKKGRTITWVLEGSEEMRYLEYWKANASAGGEGNLNLLLQYPPTKTEVLEEFLHGTQSRLGIIDKLGQNGAEDHVADFMYRHRKLLRLRDDDAKMLLLRSEGR